MKKANGILLVYDITDNETFQNITKWADEINEKEEEEEFQDSI